MQYAPKCVIQAGGKEVASFSWNDKSPYFPTKAESQANARLIAVAPELLALMTELIDIEGPQPGHIEWANKVKAAIAKATA
jgi:hypothetical protein